MTGLVFGILPARLARASYPGASGASLPEGQCHRWPTQPLTVVIGWSWHRRAGPSWPGTARHSNHSGRRRSSSPPLWRDAVHGRRLPISQAGDRTAGGLAWPTDAERREA